VGYDRLEEIGFDEPDKEIYGSARDPEVLDDPLFLEPGQSLHRPARRHHVLERLAPRLVQEFGVVQVHELQPTQPQQPQGPLDRASHLIAGEVAGLGIPIGLGRQYAALGQAPDLPEHLAYAPFALPVPVGGRRVEEVERALEDGSQRAESPLFRDGVLERIGHVAERRATDADRRHGEASLC
jgi:hypothetical protein